MLKKLFIGSLFLALPLLAGAQGTDAIDILGTVGDILNTIIPIIMVLALIYFFWGLAQYILSAGDEEKRKDGKYMMLWGIIALFVMASVWGLVGVIQDTFDIQEGSQNIPDISDLVPPIPNSSFSN